MPRKRRLPFPQTAIPPNKVRVGQGLLQHGSIWDDDFDKNDILIAYIVPPDPLDDLECHMEFGFQAHMDSLVTLYEDPVMLDDGVVINIRNHNRILDGDASTMIYELGTVSDNGTQLARFLTTGGSSGTSEGKVVSASFGTDHWVLDPTKTYLMEVLNLSSKNNKRFQIDFIFVEVEPAADPASWEP